MGLAVPSGWEAPHKGKGRHPRRATHASTTPGQGLRHGNGVSPSPAQGGTGRQGQGKCTAEATGGACAKAAGSLEGKGLSPSPEESHGADIGTSNPATRAARTPEEAKEAGGGKHNNDCRESPWPAAPTLAQMASPGCHGIIAANEHRWASSAQSPNTLLEIECEER